MKKLMILAAALAAVTAATGAPKSVPLTIAVPEQAEYVPQAARAALANKMNQIVNLNGMSASGDNGQFFLTCVVTVQDKQVVGGAPVKIAQQVDVTFYVADALNEKVFGSADVSARGVGESETKSLMAALRQIAPSQPALKKLITDSNARIIAYYEEQCDNIIQKARTLAGARAYPAAFFQLSLVPEQCACYGKILAEAERLVLEYREYEAQAMLAKARAVWSAGMDRDAAAEAAEYLAQIPYDAKCHPQALELIKEIKARVKDDIDFDRKQLEWEQQNKQDLIKGWRDIGVAYGNNQKPITYSPAWIVR
ncbi:hypothetical protein [Alistipes sp.]|uniref:hypothetical protein n=1 Tax=Alistipes sp. TaxID=1872444 RepID=UPI003AF1E164